MNIYEKILNNKERNNSLFYYLILLIINLGSLYFFLNLNIKYIFQLEPLIYLYILLALAIFNFSLVIIAIIYDLDRFIISNVFLIILIFIFTNKLFQENYIQLFILSGVFLIFNLLNYSIINRNYKSNLIINWPYLFRISWNFLIISFFIFIFNFLTFLPSFEKLTFENIYLTLNKFDNLNWISLDTKIVDILNKNIDKNLPNDIRKQAIINSIKDLNNKFNLNLETKSTLKDAISQYLTKQIETIKDSQEKIYIIKSIIAAILIATIQPIFYIIGFIVGYLSYFMMKILIALKIFKISYNQALKENIEISK
ncbi:MAG: hypothetical protein KatS3mg094_196 [Candidatus Parcubacteria bacterium]|nr:MAG: hypothetical protein KatS3mg094_196 [Candidatus Parcubacteria bacterium]